MLHAVNKLARDSKVVRRVVGPAFLGAALAATLLCGRPSKEQLHQEATQLLTRLRANSPAYAGELKDIAARLARLRDSSVLPNLIAMTSTNSAGLKIALMIALEGYESASAGAAIVTLSHDADAHVRAEALSALARAFPASSQVVFVRALSDGDGTVQFAAINGIATAPSLEAFLSIQDHLSTLDDVARGQAIDVLRGSGFSISTGLIRSLLKNPSTFSSRAAVRYLRGSREAGQFKAELLLQADRKAGLNEMLFGALASANCKAGIQYIQDGLKFHGVFVLEAFPALARLGATQFSQSATQMLESASADERVAAAFYTMLLKENDARIAKSKAILEDDFTHSSLLSSSYAGTALALMLGAQEFTVKFSSWLGTSSSEALRHRAACALQTVRRGEGISLLRAALREEVSGEVRLQLVRALVYQEDYDYLLKELDHIDLQPSERNWLGELCSYRIQIKNGMRRGRF